MAKSQKNKPTKDQEKNETPVGSTPVTPGAESEVKTPNSQQGKGKPGSSNGKRGSGKPGNGNKNNAAVNPMLKILDTNPVLTHDIASLSFGQPVGTPIDLTVPGVTHEGSVALPGIMAFNLAPIPGLALYNSDPINVAATQFYNFIRNVNSGAKNYDAPDLMMYYYTCDSLYVMHAFISRALMIINNFDILNRYTPRALFQAMNLDYDSFARNITNARALLNINANRIGTLVVPDAFPILYRHYYTFANIFRDSDLAKSQFYLYNPAFVYKYSPIADSKGGSLSPVWLDAHHHPTPWTFEELFEVYEDLIVHALNDQDTGVMGGDTLKAFGDRIFRLPLVTPDMALIPKIDAVELSNIHNMTIFPNKWGIEQGTKVSENDTWSITQNHNLYDSAIRFNPKFQSLAPWNMKRLLDINSPSPEPPIVLSTTRLMSIPKITQQAATDDIWNFDSLGTELVLGATVWTKGFNASNEMINTGLNFTSFMDVTTLNTAEMRKLDIISKFDYAPFIYMYKAGEINSAGIHDHKEYYGVIGDVWNSTTISMNDLYKMNYAYTLQMFNIQSPGTASSSSSSKKNDKSKDTGGK